MDKSPTITFGEVMKELRRRAGMSQADLARELGVHTKVLSRWELGRARPRPDYQRRILEVLSPSDTERSLLLTLVDPPLVSFRVIEEPLTVQNLTTIISALTELSTKYWLIAKDRFADLIEYTQTHNGRFADEAGVVVIKASYNSPFSMDWKVDLSAPSVAEALVTTIDGIAQRQERLEKAKLENQAKALEIRENEQKVEQDNQMALLEQEKQRLEVEARRLEVLEKQLELQKKALSMR